MTPEPERIVTIDGPAGAGKSTLARTLARRLGWTYLDTGALYRAVGLAAHEAGADVRDETAMGRIADGLELRVAPGPDRTLIFVNGRDVTEAIRQPHISALASAASALGVVRRALLELQRRMGREGRVVAEGRDMGTVVFPGAMVKFFLTASLDERARRRFLELQARGEPDALDEVREAMAARDEADSSRSLAPLKAAPDAVHLDSTGLSPEDVLERMLSVIREKTVA